MRATEDAPALAVDPRTGATLTQRKGAAYGWTCEGTRCKAEPAPVPPFTLRASVLRLTQKDGSTVALEDVLDVGDMDGDRLPVRRRPDGWTIIDRAGKVLETVPKTDDLRVRDGASWRVAWTAGVEVRGAAAARPAGAVPAAVNLPTTAPLRLPDARPLVGAPPALLMTGKATVRGGALVWSEGATPKWEAAARAFVDATASIVIVIDADGHIEARGRADGQVRWTHAPVENVPRGSSLARPVTDGSRGVNGYGQPIRYTPTARHPYFATADDLLVGGEDAGTVTDAKTGKVLVQSKRSVLAAARGPDGVVLVTDDDVHWSLGGAMSGGPYDLAPPARLLVAGGRAMVQDGSMIRAVDTKGPTWEMRSPLPAKIVGAAVVDGRPIFWDETWWVALDPATGAVVEVGSTTPS